MRIFLVVFWIFMISLAGFAQGADPREIYIIWDCDNLDESQNYVKTHMQNRVAAINAERKDIKVKFEVTDAQNIIEYQIASMEAVILKKPDILMFSYVDPDALRDSVKAVRDAGIIVIDYRDMKDHDNVDGVFYGNHEPTYAKSITNWLIKYLAKNPDVTLRAGIIYGAVVQTPQLARGDLVKHLAAEFPNRVKILAQQYADWDTTKAQNTMEDWLVAYGNKMNYVAVANTGMALGATNALVSANRMDDFIITSVDLTDSGVGMVKDGLIHALAGAYNPDRAKAAINFALGVFEGTYTKKTYTMETYHLLDSKNIDEFLAMRKQDLGY